ncbi:hypothetical protein ACWDVV_36845, partial [Streptomyces tendae]
TTLRARHNLGVSLRLLGRYRDAYELNLENLGSGPPNAVASRLAADHGAAPVAGPAVVTGPLLYGSPYPLGAEEITQVSGRLHG